MIQRKPILTPSNRRNPDNHPEFLDPEMLLIRFDPLIRSVYNEFVNWEGLFTDKPDREDLMEHVKLEFLRLRQNYNPHRGVDFNGYISLLLKQRVYHYVMKVQADRNKYQYDSGEEGIQDHISMLATTEDETAVQELNRVDALASIDWDSLTEEQADLVRAVLINHETPEDIARRRHVTIRSVKDEILELCDYFYEYAQGIVYGT